MTELIKDFERLSPAKQKLLLRRLKAQTAQAERDAEIIPRSPRRGQAEDVRFPLSFAQQRLWFLSRLEPGLPHYHLPTALRLTGPLQVAVLERALAEVTRRHESLRTVFETAGGEPFQRILPPPEVSDEGTLPRVDLSALPEAAREAEALRLAAQEARRPFDIAAGPHLRATLLRLAADGSEHALLFTMHHIVSDGWSMGVLVQEVQALYAAFAAAQSSPLPDLAIQYPDFADWQRGWLTGEVLAEQTQYWRDRLAGAPAALDLPTDRPRPALPSYRGAQLGLLLPHDLLDRLAAVKEREGDTLFMTLLAAFGALLSRYTGQDDVSIGSPIANRNRFELEGLIGFFVNTLVLRVETDGDPTFQELLGRVRETTLGAYAHQDLPFEKLVEELRPERDLSRSPLFQVMFILQNTRSALSPQGAEPAAGVPALGLAPLEVPGITSKFDLTLSTAESPAGLSVGVEYNTDLFDETTIRRLLGHFSHLLAAVAAGPHWKVSELPLLSELERHQLLREWDGPGPDFAREIGDAHLYEVFAAQAARTPEALALVVGGKSWTYAGLDQEAGRLARRLRAHGAGPERIVAVYASRGAELIVALLAVLKAGAAYLPLDPANPRERLAWLLEDSGALLVLAEASLAQALPETALPRLLLGEEAGDQDLQAGQDEDGSLDPGSLDSGNLAYLIYTSGSTGRPKGVLVAHRHVWPVLRWAQGVFALGEGTRVQQTLSPAFDFGLFEILTTLLFGGTLYIPEAGELADPRLYASHARRHGVDTIHATPSFIQALAQTGSRLEGLRTLHLGGEAITPALAGKLFDAVGDGCRLYNGYGPTEAAVNSALFGLGTRQEWGEGRASVPIGRPSAGNQGYVLDRSLEPVPTGVAGELYVGGAGVARGYLHRPDLTAERFVPDPFGGEPGARLYRTGDKVRFVADGNVEFLGRLDHQVKLRGFRIELGEIEAALLQHPAVSEAAVVVRGTGVGEKADQRLVAYLAPEGAPEPGEMRAFLQGTLPEPMIPSAWVALPALPRNANGKLDRKALPAPQARTGEAAAAPPTTEVERAIAAIWRDVLGVEEVGTRDNFFDLGGHSLLLVQVHERLRHDLGDLAADLPLIDLFRFPDVASLARHLSGRTEEAASASLPLPGPSPVVLPRATSRDVAIVGMAGRFPRAADLDELWRNLRDGVEAISFFTPEELRAAGLGPETIGNPDHVPARGVLEGADLFDAGYFDYSPLEAQLTDPQQRLFLESAAEALQHAGYDPSGWKGRIGVFAGTGISSYGIANLFSNPDVPPWAGGLTLSMGNDKDFVATRVAYKLDLRGPALTVQTACSTSLVAIHTACRSLLDGECEMALAGGVSARFPQKQGYVYQEGGINSPDGHNRSFDASARGTVGGDGVGIVVLKPLSAALADGDTIHAVIRGSAINNDGSGKVGFTAPSVNGQAEVIAGALAAAGVRPETIHYVETHGSATPLGDPIEVAALNQAFGRGRGRETCAIGSIKSNVGHLDAAAGAAGLIKTVLALKNREIPPSLHFERPNPRIDFASGPFFVNTRLRPWESGGEPRRAGVSSFGLGGTNVHVILEEAPAPPPPAPSRPWQLLVLSAKSEAALERATDGLAGWLGGHSGDSLAPNLADAAFTLQVGRRPLDFRRAVVCQNVEDAREALASRDPRRVLDGVRSQGERPVAFLFPGLGDQYPGMGRDLYRSEPAFQEAFDRCADILLQPLGVDLRELLYPEGAEETAAPAAAGPDLRRMLRRAEPESTAGPLARTAVAQPVVFAVEFALASLWMSWGLRPQAVIGYSLGEYVAACLSGVLSLEDALTLVAERALWIDELPEGAMLAVALSEEELAPLLGDDLSLAAVNGPRLCVASGPPEAIEALEQKLGVDGVATRRLETTHAFHSRMMEPLAGRLTERVSRLELHPPQIPYLSNVTGGWMTTELARDPGYWARHLCEPVRFSDGIAELWREPARVLLEVGPGRSLTSLALQHPACTADPSVDRVAVTSLPSAYERQPSRAALLHSLAKLWLAGAEVDWQGLYYGEMRRRIPLPTYPFERQRYWIDPPRRQAANPALPAGPGRRAETWEPGPALAPLGPGELSDDLTKIGARWLILATGPDGKPEGLGARVARRLVREGLDAVVVTPGDGFAKTAEKTYAVSPGRRADWAALFEEAGTPRRVLHLWGLDSAAAADDVLVLFERAQVFAGSLLPLLRELADRTGGTGGDTVNVLVAADRLLPVTGTEALPPEKAAARQVCEALAARHPHLRCRIVDLLPPENGQRIAWEEALVERLLAELARDLSEPAVAYRGDDRWLPRELPATPEPAFSQETSQEIAPLPTPPPATAGHARPNLRNAYVEPANDLERSLAAIWQGLLGVASVGRHDSFFEMGGHSLLATSLMAEIRKRFGVSLPIASLFETPTLAELAGVVEQERGALAGAEDPTEPESLIPVVVIDPAHRYEPFPLTDIQQAYWLGRQATFELGNVGAHIYWEMDFTGLDLGRMTLAMRRCIDRHEMLRAIVRPDGKQVILKDVPPFHIGTMDLRSLSPEEREEQLLGIRRQMSHQVLQPDRWPMFEMRAALIDGKRIRLYTSVDVLIGDGHSFGLLGGDLARFYANPELDVPPLELSFRDYVLAEAALQETAAFERSLAYWRERVASLPPAPELPMVKAPAALEKPRFQRWTSRLEEPLWKPLKERGARAGLTPSGLLLAAFSEVLAAWSKTPRFTITLTLFNRMPVHPQVNDLVGDFTSLTLLGVDMSADGGFEARARAVQQRLWQDLDHRMVSGVRVLRELARHQGRQAAAAMPVVFTSAINQTGDNNPEAPVPAEVQNEPAPASAEIMAGQDWEGPSSEMVYVISQTPQVWLDHQIGEYNGSLTFNWDVVAELFPPGLIDDMFNTYKEFLVRLATDEAAWTQDRRRLIPAGHLARRVSVNATGAALSEEYVHTLFEKRALEAPERVAVIAPERTLTYGELRTHANRLGRILRERGARPNTLVAVVMEKSWEMVVAVMGVQVSGAAYLPIEPGLPKERIHLLLERGEVEFVLTQSWINLHLEWPENVQRIVVDHGVGFPGEEGDWAGVDDSFLKPVQSLSDLSYVIFTSGSTGLPKGVMTDHRGAVNTIVDLNERFSVGPDDRVLAVSSLSFDLSVYDIFGLLAAGGAVVMPQIGRAWDPAHWAERVATHNVTIWNTVPALMKLLVEHIEGAAGHAGNGNGHGNGAGVAVPLRLVMMSGDWIPLDLPDRIRAIAGPGIRVMSLGGATEASIWSILYPIGKIEPEWKSVPYGKPMVNQTFHVLDDRLEPRPDWVPGNLYIGGVGLAKGYWRDPEKTAASFVVHPDTRERLYRTGDLGRYYPDGNIEFLGREDFQVKIQGYRIELGEIEAALGEHPAVREAVVSAVGERMGNKRLVAYVVPSADAGERELTGDLREALRAHLRSKLPEYMVPSIFITLTALPLGPTGKVDRKALPAPDLALLDAGKDFVEPRTDTERTLAGIWTELLKAPRVGAHDNFYELGGDSLLATQVMSRVRESFRVELPLQTFFEAPTLETLAEAVDRATISDSADGTDTAETDALAALVQQLQDASPEEVDRLLAELRQQEEGGLGG